jgi:hypothetical protein
MIVKATAGAAIRAQWASGTKLFVAIVLSGVIG